MSMDRSNDRQDEYFTAQCAADLDDHGCARLRVAILQCACNDYLTAKKRKCKASLGSDRYKKADRELRNIKRFLKELSYGERILEALDKQDAQRITVKRKG